MSPARPWVIAHRGHSAAAAENSVSALEQAIVARADAVEADVRISSDGIAVVSHDAHLSRLAGDNGAVADLPAEELDARARRAGAEIPRLATLMRAAQGRIPLMLDVKERNPIVLTHIASAAVEAGFPASALILGLRDAALVRPSRTQLPDADILALHGESDPLQSFREAGVTLVRLWEAQADPVTVSGLRSQGCTVWATTGGPKTGRDVGDATPESLGNLIAAGIGGILINDPDLGRHAVDNP